MADDGRHKALDAALQELTKRFGDGAVVRLGDAQHLQISSIPSGSLAVDIAIGVGGLPRGRITEIYGPESSGKTTLCLHTVAEAQKLGGLCAFIDMEHALDALYAAKIGVDVNNLYVSQPDTAEQALEIVEALVRSGVFDVVILDSVAALVPKAEIEGEMGDSHMGLQARLMSQALRKLPGAIQHSNCDIMLAEGISKVGDILDIGTEIELIEKKGAFYRYNNGLLGQGREASKEFLKANPVIANEIETSVRIHYGLLQEPAPKES